MNKGWISVHRELKDHWIWNEDEPFTKRCAWIDLLLTVNHKEGKVMMDGLVKNIPRGSTLTSLSKLSKKWRWSRNKVRRFLELLESDGMIKLQIKDSKWTGLSICNYDSYQNNQTGKEQLTDTKRTGNGQVTDINNNVNNKNNDNNLSVNIPDWDDFWNYAESKAYTEEYAQHLYDSLKARGWLGKNDQFIHDWKSYLNMMHKYQRSFTSKLKENETATYDDLPFS